MKVLWRYKPEGGGENKKMIVYFSAESAAYFNYMLPILKKTGGVFVTESKSLYNFVTSHYLFVKCYLDKGQNLSRYHPDVIVLGANECLKIPAKCKLVQVFHGLTDKRAIYQKSGFKDSNSLLLASLFIERYLPKRFRKFSLLSDDLWSPFRFLGLDKLIKNRYDLLCLTGKHMEEKLRSLNLLTENNWKAVGFPRLDCVTNNELSKEDIFKDLNLDPTLKTILYAPTWRGEQKVNLSSIPDMGLKICKLIGDDMNFIFKPHPNVKANNEFPETMRKIIRYIKKHPNFVYPDAFVDTIPLMFISDLLITDFSTVAIEYLAFDRPIMFADHLGEKYNDTNLVEVFIRETGEIVRNPNEFKSVIKKCLDNPSEKSKIRRKFRDYFFYTLDGRAAERAANAILELENTK